MNSSSLLGKVFVDLDGDEICVIGADNNRVTLRLRDGEVVSTDIANITVDIESGNLFESKSSVSANSLSKSDLAKKERL